MNVHGDHLYKLWKFRDSCVFDTLFVHRLWISQPVYAAYISLSMPEKRRIFPHLSHRSKILANMPLRLAMIVAGYRRV